MKYLLAILVLLGTPTLQAGWFSSFQEPPVTVSMKLADSAVNVTNTSDEVIHAVVASSPDGKESVTVADTIEAHKTVKFEWGGNNTIFISEFNITCKGYGSKKIKLSYQ